MLHIRYINESGYENLCNYTFTEAVSSSVNVEISKESRIWIQVADGLISQIDPRTTQGWVKGPTNSKDQFEGHVRSGQFVGFGKLTMSKTQITYEGFWRNSSLIHGTSTSAQDGIYRGTFNASFQKNGKFGIWMKNGSSYKGAWENGQRHGWGVFKGSDGEVKEGTWRQDVFTQGTHIQPLKGGSLEVISVGSCGGQASLIIEENCLKLFFDGALLTLSSRGLPMTYIGSQREKRRHGGGVMKWGAQRFTMREYEEDRLISEQQADGLDSVFTELAVQLAAISPAALVLNHLDDNFKSLMKQIKPPSAKDYREIINQVAQAAKGCATLAVAEIVPAGSYGKGTMVENESDIDIVVLLSNFQESQYSQYLSSSKDILEKHIAFPVEVSQHALQFQVNGIDVDLLFGGILQTSELTRPTSLGSADYLSPSRAKLQVEAIAKQPEQFKDLVRLLKWWRSLFVWTRNTHPKSYLLELVALDAYSRAESKKDSFNSLFLQTMKSLMNLKTTPVLSSHNENQLPPSIKCQRPLVLDICNSGNNIAVGMDVRLLELYALLTVRLIESVM